MMDAAVTGILSLLATQTVLPSFTVDIDQLDGYLRVAGEIIAVVFFVAWVRKRADKKTSKEQQEQRADMEARLIETLIQRTQPIQPKYRNDGESLADIANEVKRIKEVQGEQAQVLTSVHRNVADATVEMALHRAAVNESFASIREERAVILAAAAAQTEAWRVALEKQGLEVPPSQEPS
jgi:hypothetical protein